LYAGRTTRATIGWIQIAASTAVAVVSLHRSFIARGRPALYGCSRPTHWAFAKQMQCQFSSVTRRSRADLFSGVPQLGQVWWTALVSPRASTLSSVARR